MGRVGFFGRCVVSVATSVYVCAQCGAEYTRYAPVNGEGEEHRHPEESRLWCFDCAAVVERDRKVVLKTPDPWLVECQERYEKETNGGVIANASFETRNQYLQN